MNDNMRNNIDELEQVLKTAFLNWTFDGIDCEDLCSQGNKIDTAYIQWIATAIRKIEQDESLEKLKVLTTKLIIPKDK